MECALGQGTDGSTPRPAPPIPFRMYALGTPPAVEPIITSASPDDHAVRTRLSRVMMGADFPVLSRMVSETLGTLDDDASSLQQLAEVVLREYGLAMTVLRTANSAHYRRGGRPTESATQAMMVLGARTVRQLAGSMVLFEHFRRRSPELKELIINSLLTANHARATAIHLGEDDPEAAHLCGMFRNLGEVLTACYFHEDYQRIQSLVRDDGRSDAEAMRMALGCSYADFGAAVAAHWGLPDAIGESILAHVGDVCSCNATIATFSDALTRELYTAPPATRSGGLDDLLDAHKRSLGLTRVQAGKVVSEALMETQALLHTIDEADRVSRMHTLADAARGVFGAGLTLPESDAPIVLEAPDPSTRSRLLRELAQAAQPSSGTAIGTVFLQALEVLTRGAPFDRSIVCFLTADRLELIARTGVGAGVESLLPRFAFPVSPRGGPVVALTQQRQPVYVPTDRALTASEKRWAQEFGVSQFGVFPLVVLGKVIGCVYVDRATQAPAPDRATVRFAQEVVDLVVDAIANRRR
jgi:HD-like signal output (HDOD) protein